MTEETHFQRYLPEPHPQDALVPPEEIKRHILCTGQVYYTLIAEREARGIKDVAISRLEQISPFPYDLVSGFNLHLRIRWLTWCLDRSHHTWTSILTRLRSGVKRSR